MFRTTFALAAVLTFAACDLFSSEPDFDNLGGSYHGTINGAGSGFTVNGSLTATLNQTGGHLTGHWTISGTISDGVDTAVWQSTENFTGTVAEGRNPQVSLTFTVPHWGGETNTYTGQGRSHDLRITLTGTTQITYALTC